MNEKVFPCRVYSDIGCGKSAARHQGVSAVPGKNNIFKGL